MGSSGIRPSSAWGFENRSGQGKWFQSKPRCQYDGYVECIRTRFSSAELSIPQLMNYFFEIIDPYSLNRQGPDTGLKYRTGVYSKNPYHLTEAREFIDAREDSNRIAVEVLPLLFYVRSAEEHQDRLTKFPEEKCHIPKEVLFRYR